MSRATGPPAGPGRRARGRASSVRLLRARLDEAEQALEAIRAGDVDALVTRGPGGERIFTLEGADHGYRVLLEVMSEGVAKLTQQGAIAYCNARFADILGVPLERTIGSSIHDLVAPGERDRFLALLSTGDLRRSEGEFRLHAPGALADVPVLLSVVPLTMRGAPTHCLVMTDLTERWRHEGAMAAGRAAMQLRLFLGDRMSSLGTLAAGVAHEVNNPLAYVIASLELMIGRLPGLGAAGPSGEQAAWFSQQLDRAREGSERVRVIVRDLNAFSRADDETVAATNLRRALDTSIALVSNDIRHRARLVQDYEGLPAVCANEARLGQVFVNLLVNAAHAVPEGAADKNAIRVIGRTDAAGNAVVEISDTGCGISAENVAHIFEPFFTTKPVGMGTGLGLALCYSVVSALGGEIAVESTPGVGSLFRVIIPAAPATSDDVVAAATEVLVDSRGRLLVVDDERDLGEVLREALVPFHDVVTTTDARRALESIAAGARFDLILCDMKMPDMTGLEFYTRLQAASSEQAGRVVLMSGGFTRQRGGPAVPLPAPILEKPFEIERVLALMSEALRGGVRPDASRA